MLSKEQFWQIHPLSLFQSAKICNDFAVSCQKNDPPKKTNPCLTPGFSPFKLWLTMQGSERWNIFHPSEKEHGKKKHRACS